MDEGQRQSLLRCIAVSSGILPASQIEKNEAFSYLEEFKAFDGSVTLSLDFLGQERVILQIYGNDLDITVSTKLLALTVTQNFLKVGYAKLNEGDRMSLRGAIVAAVRQLASTTSPQGQPSRILGMKMASLLADMVIRDFPQRWTTFVSDVLVPPSRGGIWCEPDGRNMIGVMIVLECFKIITEDCTDSDYNAKISTSRRNDVLIGLNEVSSQFLTPIFQVISGEYSILVRTNQTIREMEAFLKANGRNVAQMTDVERNMYNAEIEKRGDTIRLMQQCLTTLSRFCQAMPLDWLMTTSTKCSSSGAQGQNDFVAVFLHLLREDSVQVLAVECLEQLASRKLDFDAWWRLISSLPKAVSEANQFQTSNGNIDLAEQLSFHRGLSKMLATLVSAHIAQISTDKDIVNGAGPKFDSFSNYFSLLSELLDHPSGRICSEQINTWVAMLRDPQIVRAGILRPYMSRLLTSYMRNVVRVRWDDVEDQSHPFAALLEASWDDKDAYDVWMCDLRSKGSQLFKFIGNTEPQLATTMIADKVQTLISNHGSGQPGDHLDPVTRQLTVTSEACIQFEGVYQPLENILSGIPSWAIEETSLPLPNKDNTKKEIERSEIRASVRTALSRLAEVVVNWKPIYVWLKFRHATLLEAMKHYWKYDPTTLPSGVDNLFSYLDVADEWKHPDGAVGGGQQNFSGEVVGLKKKTGMALVSVAKLVPHHLVHGIAELSGRARTLLASPRLLPMNRMHLYEFLSCVATAVQDPALRSSFIADVLSDAFSTLESATVKETLSSMDQFLKSLGIVQAGVDASTVMDVNHVKRVTLDFQALFSAFNQLLSVGKRCSEAAKKRSKDLIASTQKSALDASRIQHFPDEGQVSLSNLALKDPFVVLWPKILPALLRTLELTLKIWSPETQAILLRDPIQRYVLAISDDEAYLAKKQENKSGVFGEGGTAGSVVAGWDRRDVNLAPKWSGWFNELRNTCFQLLGLMAGQRVLFAPELEPFFPQLVGGISSKDTLLALEHRHLTQLIKQFFEILILSCPSTLYKSHVAPLLGPLMEHVQYRLEKSWAPVTNPTVNCSTSALSSTDTLSAAMLASRGGEEWYSSYYARAGLFVADLDAVTAEALVEKNRVDLSHAISDMLQTGLALKGDWALVLANFAKEEQATKRNDPSKLTHGPRNQPIDGGLVNANGSPRSENDVVLDTRKYQRICAFGHFLLLEDQRIAAAVTICVINALGYPDAYTCRRCTRICHRILETVAWSTSYSQVIGEQMFIAATKNVVTEPKWMVGIEWDMINVIRDIYCRLVLGQTLVPGGQGPGMQQPPDQMNPGGFEQAKSVEDPLHGGGILAVPSDLPRRILASLPGVSVEMVKEMEAALKQKRSAKDQKDTLRDFLRIVAENSKGKEDEGNTGAANGIFGRAVEEESLLHKSSRKSTVPDIPEKLVTATMMQKKLGEKGAASDARQTGLSAFGL